MVVVMYQEVSGRWSGDEASDGQEVGQIVNVFVRREVFQRRLDSVLDGFGCFAGLLKGLS